MNLSTSKAVVASAVLLLSVLPLPQAVAQVRPPQPRHFEELQGFYEALNLVGDDTTKCRLDLNYRIPHRFFVFVRSFSSPDEFVARGIITAEILDSKNVSVARDIMRKELKRLGTMPPEATIGAAIHGSFSFTLAPGTYRVHFEVEDLESNRKMTLPSPPLHLKKFHDLSPGISDPLAIERVDSAELGARYVYPANLGGDIPFGTNFYFLCQSTGWVDSSATLRYVLHKFDASKKKQTVLSDSVHPTSSLADVRLTPVKNDPFLVYSLETRLAPPKVHTYLIPIRGDTLSTGEYEIEIKGSGGRSTRKSFAIRWLDRPRSLMNDEFAAAALEYLMSEKEFDEFMTKDPEERKKEFEEFWKKRDPTPSTAFNEAMAEYYRRCDYALENFATIGVPNGLKTDRGKIYVLYGPPTSTDRTLSLDAPPREIWEYKNLGRRFVFIDESRSGNYKLLYSEKL